MAVAAERTTIELAGKIRMIATCSACRGFLQQPSVMTPCFHYLCFRCAEHHKTQCPKCQMTGSIRRVEYLDNVAATLHQIRDILVKESLPEQKKQNAQGLAKKRKQDYAFPEDERPSPKSNKVKSTLAKKTQLDSPLASQDNPNIGGQVIFARKSTPVTPSTPHMGTAHITGGAAGHNRAVEVPTPTRVSGSVVPKKLLKQTLLSPVLTSQRPVAMDSDDGTTTSQDTDFSFSGIATQVESGVQQASSHQTEKSLSVSGTVAVSAIDKAQSLIAFAANAETSAISLGRSRCCGCQCHNTIPIKSQRSSAVQVQNSMLTLDVSTSTPRVVLKDMSVGTDPLVPECGRSLSAHSISVEVQTDRPYVAPPKRYREAIVQTDPDVVGDLSEADQTLRPESPPVPPSLETRAGKTESIVKSSQIYGTDNAAIELPPSSTSDSHGSRSSTQTASGQSIHAQPMSLDMSPIKQQATSIERSVQDNIIEQRSQREKTRHTGVQQIGRDATDEKDSLDSVDFTSCELGAKQQTIITTDADKTTNPPSSTEKDTLESMFRSSQEGSIPETLPPMVSPAKKEKTPKKASVAGVSRMASCLKPLNGSPMGGEDSQFVLPARRTIDLSDEEAEDFMANIDTQLVTTKRKKPAGKLRENKISESPTKSQKGRRRVANLVMSSDEEDANEDFAGLASFGSSKQKETEDAGRTLPISGARDDDDDEDEDEPIAPLDTEDMKNLEREIENLDREIEDSKNTATFRKSR